MGEVVEVVRKVNLDGVEKPAEAKHAGEGDEDRGLSAAAKCTQRSSPVMSSGLVYCMRTSARKGFHESRGRRDEFERIRKSTDELPGVDRAVPAEELAVLVGGE